MESNQTSSTSFCNVATFVRNRYFYGKLLDVSQFEMEQTYFNAKRRLLNRLITGYGVVCGLDVRVAPDGKSVVVLAGVAIDKWGRETIVPVTSMPQPVPNLPGGDNPPSECDPASWVQLTLCYHECQSDPVPALGGDCDQNALCSPGSIRESYELRMLPGKAPDVNTDCGIQDLISNNRINYTALAQYVTGACGACPEDPCIPLANIHLPAVGATIAANDINIAVRPIVYTNDLLLDLLVCLNKTPSADYARGGKG